MLGDLRPWIGILLAGAASWYAVKQEVALLQADAANFVRVERVVKIETEIKQLQARDGASDDDMASLKADMTDRMNRLEGKIDEVLKWQRRN